MPIVNHYPKTEGSLYGGSSSVYSDGAEVVVQHVQRPKTAVARHAVPANHDDDDDEESNDKDNNDNDDVRGDGSGQDQDDERRVNMLENAGAPQANNVMTRIQITLGSPCISDVEGSVSSDPLPADATNQASATAAVTTTTTTAAVTTTTATTADAASHTCVNTVPTHVSSPSTTGHVSPLPRAQATHTPSHVTIHTPLTTATSATMKGGSSGADLNQAEPATNINATAATTTSTTTTTTMTATTPVRAAKHRVSYTPRDEDYDGGRQQGSSRHTTAITATTTSVVGIEDVVHRPRANEFPEDFDLGLSMVDDNDDRGGSGSNSVRALTFTPSHVRIVRAQQRPNTGKHMASPNTGTSATVTTVTPITATTSNITNNTPNHIAASSAPVTSTFELMELDVNSNNYMQQHLKIVEEDAKLREIRTNIEDKDQQMRQHIFRGSLENLSSRRRSILNRTQSAPPVKVHDMMLALETVGKYGDVARINHHLQAPSPILEATGPETDEEVENVKLEALNKARPVTAPASQPLPLRTNTKFIRRPATAMELKETITAKKTPIDNRPQFQRKPNTRDQRGSISMAVPSPSKYMIQFHPKSAPVRRAGPTNARFNEEYQWIVDDRGQPKFVANERKLRPRSKKASNPMDAAAEIDFNAVHYVTPENQEEMTLQRMAEAIINKPTLTTRVLSASALRSPQSLLMQKHYQQQQLHRSQQQYTVVYSSSEDEDDTPIARPLKLCDPNEVIVRPPSAKKERRPSREEAATLIQRIFRQYSQRKLMSKASESTETSAKAYSLNTTTTTVNELKSPSILFDRKAAKKFDLELKRAQKIRHERAMQMQKQLNKHTMDLQRIDNKVQPSKAVMAWTKSDDAPRLSVREQQRQEQMARWKEQNAIRQKHLSKRVNQATASDLLLRVFHPGKFTQKELRIRNQAATKIQAWWRGIKFREQMKEILQRQAELYSAELRIPSRRSMVPMGSTRGRIRMPLRRSSVASVDLESGVTVKRKSSQVTSAMAKFLSSKDIKNVMRDYHNAVDGVNARLQRAGIKTTVKATSFLHVEDLNNRRRLSARNFDQTADNQPTLNIDQVVKALHDERIFASIVQIKDAIIWCSGEDKPLISKKEYIMVAFHLKPPSAIEVTSSRQIGNAHDTWRTNQHLSPDEYAQLVKDTPFGKALSVVVEALTPVASRKKFLGGPNLGERPYTAHAHPHPVDM